MVGEKKNSALVVKAQANGAAKIAGNVDKSKYATGLTQVKSAPFKCIYCMCVEKKSRHLQSGQIYYGANVLDARAECIQFYGPVKSNL